MHLKYNETDWGVCIWPWQLFALRKADCPIFVTSNGRIPLKNTIGWSAAPFFACEITQFFPVVICVVRTVHKFEFRIVINQTPNKWRPVERMSCSNRDSYFWHDLCICLRQCSWVFRDYSHDVQVGWILLSKRQYILYHILVTPMFLYNERPFEKMKIDLTFT